jgi:hypothetical protein
VTQSRRTVIRQGKANNKTTRIMMLIFNVLSRPDMQRFPPVLPAKRREGEWKVHDNHLQYGTLVPVDCVVLSSNLP